ncbi:hypothetical protein RND81_06G052400 [Saponaria officinalis]|uniref:GrpE protein homolog n=1 Tax=Saponaria officinalis TaxID=3572 RepID=A0AAW1K850_SAPOF
MAISLSTTHIFLHNSISIQSYKQPSNSQKTLIFPLNFPSKTHHFPPLSISSSNPISTPIYSHSRCNNHTFKCFVSQNDPFNTMEEEEEKDDTSKDGETEDTGDKKRWESVETLTSFYKEAILAGDYQTITEIETSLYRLETEKNELAEKLSTMSEEITAGKERYIRLQADFDNFRKRSDKERLSVRSDAQGEVIESLLPMVDNFERAKQQLKAETDREKQIDTSYQGIYKQFVEIMRSLRVSVVATVGKPFDPALHEAIAREESEEYKDGIIIQEFRRGFILGDRLLRPAMVKVSSGPGKKKHNNTDQSTTDQPAFSPAAGVEEP